MSKKSSLVTNPELFPEFSNQFYFIHISILLTGSNHQFRKKQFQTIILLMHILFVANMMNMTEALLLCILLTKSNHQFWNFHEFLNQFYVVFLVTAAMDIRLNNKF